MPALLIEVGDTTRALQDLAREVRRRSGARVVAITGSAGKTTTKEVIAEFLSARFDVFRNKGNLNNHIGLPLSLLELRARPRGRRRRARDESCRRDQDARRHRRAGSAGVDQRRRRTPRASSPPPTRSPTPSPRFSRRRTARTCSSRTPTIRASWNGRARFPGRVVTFGIDTDADVRAGHGPAPRPRGHGGGGDDARRHGAAADAAPRPRQPVERAGGHRRRPAFRSAARRDDRPGRPAVAGAPSRRDPAAAGRHHPHRRFVQLEPGGAGTFARNRRVGDRQRPQGCRARRDARAGLVRRVAASAIGRARGARRDSIC